MAGAHASVRPRSRTRPRRSDLHRRDVRQQDRALRSPNPDLQGVGSAGRRPAARVARRPRRPGLVHRKRRRHHRPPRGVIWFTVQSGHRIGRMDTRTGTITEYKAAGNPYGIALDKGGNVWFCQLSGDKLGRLDPKTGTITELVLERGSHPRRMAAAQDGSLWVTQYGNGKL